MGKSFGYFGGSITACCACDSNSVAIAQVGGGRAYRCRGGKLELLVPDHMLSTVAATHADVAGDPQLHSNVVTSLLGVCNDLQLDQATVSIESGDAIILCSHSVWSHSGELVAALCRHRVVDVADVEQLVADCAARENHDATMVVIQFFSQAAE
jgi:serine/threonine protein phosphatase PrpC